ncbi:MAG: hypothetical protein J0M10_03615 [Chitinophagales bacterium]|nr:hypothetical protein [Chitinophagales bacterium]
MKYIEVSIGSVLYKFEYSIKKSSDTNKKDRFWEITVTHSHTNLVGIPNRFQFSIDTLNNIQLGAINGAIQIIAEKILEQEQQ